MRYYYTPLILLGCSCWMHEWLDEQNHLVDSSISIFFVVSAYKENIEIRWETRNGDLTKLCHRVEFKISKEGRTLACRSQLPLRLVDNEWGMWSRHGK